jgi:hypothetical protein
MTPPDRTTNCTKPTKGPIRFVRFVQVVVPPRIP